MSDQTPIKTPKQLIKVIIFSFIFPVVAILFLANYVDWGNKAADEQAKTPEATQARISPVAKLNYIDPNLPPVYKTGQEVYQAVCMSCHDSGAAGAPKIGDMTAWGARLGQGYEGLLSSLLNGKGAMSARAGTSVDDYSDYELGRAVVYLSNKSGASLTEPQAPVFTAPSEQKTEEVAMAAVPMPVAPIVSASAASVPAKIEVAKIDPAAHAALGKKIYEQACIACHASGAAGAPKLEDKAAWSARIATGKEALYLSAINGKNAMPAKGGYMGSDDDVKAAVDYMIATAK